MAVTIRGVESGSPAARAKIRAVAGSTSKSMESRPFIKVDTEDKSDTGFLLSRLTNR